MLHAHVVIKFLSSIIFINIGAMLQGAHALNICETDAGPSVEHKSPTAPLKER